MTDAPPPPPVYATAAPYQLTSKGKRFGAFLLEIVLAIVTLGIGWLIWSIILWSKGQSPAKSLMKMRVLKLETGRAAEVGDMVMRELLGKWVLGIVPFYTLISSIIVLTDEKSQGLWDKIAGTVVIDDPDDQYAPAA